MNQPKLSVALVFADLFWSVWAMGIALLLRYGVHWSGADKASAWHLLPFLGAMWVIWVLFSFSLPLDGFRGGWRFSAVVSQLLIAVGLLMSILLSGGYLARDYVSRLALFEFCLVLLAGFVLIRAATYGLLRARASNGSARRVVVMGRGRLSRELARKIQCHPEMLCRVVGFLAPDDGTEALGRRVDDKGFAVRESGPGVVDLLSAERIDEVILVPDECSSPDLLNLVARCRERGIKVSLVPQLYDLYRSRSHLADLGGLPVLQLGSTGLRVSGLIAKRVLDLTLGMLLSLFSLPILLPLAVILRWSKGRAFLSESRCGLHGKPFSMLRLNVNRTAVNSSRFESILSDYSLTELPQLWNVLRGEMSLVGPRPESRDRVCRYSEWQQQRLTVKPGMTGLAQVQGLREQHTSEEKSGFDLQYLLHSSPWNDLSLLLQTVWTLAMRSVDLGGSANAGAHGRRMEPSLSMVQEEVLENAHRS